MTFSQVILLLVAGTLVPAEKELRQFEAAQRSMGVEFKIALYAADAETARAAFQRAFARIDELDGRFSDYREDSELSLLSATAGSDKFVPVSDELWRILCQSRKFSEQSGGAFDVTVGPLTTLWRAAIRDRALPDKSELEQALKATGYRLIEFDKSAKTIKLTRPGMRLDLGGIAKGYAADEALQVLREMGINHAMVDASGDLAFGDAPPGKAGWKVQIAALDNSALPQDVLVLKNCGAATSGDKYQFLEVDGKRYSHIVDPRTGYGVLGKGSFTVIASDATQADALASAVSVLGLDGTTLLEKTDHFQGLIQLQIDNKIQTKQTAGFKQFLK